jgi:hypothetical protein
MGYEQIVDFLGLVGFGQLRWAGKNQKRYNFVRGCGQSFREYDLIILVTIVGSFRGGLRGLVAPL